MVDDTQQKELAELRRELGVEEDAPLADSATLLRFYLHKDQDVAMIANRD